MPLTLRSSGVAGGLVTTAWWNDYYYLFTGVTQDQNLWVKNGLNLQMIGPDPSTTPTVTALAASGNLGVGVYQYYYTWKNNDEFQTYKSPTQSVTTSSGHTQVSVVCSAAVFAGVTKTNIYRTKVGGSTFYFVGQLLTNGGTFTDNVADTSLTIIPVDRTNFGGSILFSDNLGNINGKIANDGVAGGRMTFSSPGFFDFQIPDGTTVCTIAPNSIRLQGANPYIQIPNGSYLGFRMANGTKLAEIKSTGNFIISGSQYQTSAGTISTVASQSFDAFDVGEAFQCDAKYAKGTIVCPGPNGKLTQCTHDNCHAAMVISYEPGLGLGAPDIENGEHYIALAGSVSCRTAADILPRQLLVSNGRGGVRPVNYEEPAFVLGFSLTPTVEDGDMKGTVGVFLRSMFVILKKPV